MERYLNQLLADIREARNNVPVPWWDFIDMGDDDEDDEFSAAVTEQSKYAPVKSLEEHTGLRQEQLPPACRLNEHQTHRLLRALKGLLTAYNCHVVFQRPGIPEAVQYEIIRTRFRQELPFGKDTHHFFTFCDSGQEHATCSLGEYCECRFIQHLLTMDDREQKALESETGELDSSQFHMRRRYGNDLPRYESFFEEEEDEDLLGDEDDE